MKIIQENSCKVNVSLPKEDVNSKLEVFYNPLMKSNRDISILLLNSIDREKMKIALPLAGSGIRGIRFLKELNEGKLDLLLINDKKEDFPKNFQKNLDLNNIKTDKVECRSDDAVNFILTQHRGEWCGYFDYIDIDPFGSPNPFLSAAVARINRGGVIAITATDTAALSGTYPKVTQRKYWANPFVII